MLRNYDYNHHHERLNQHTRVRFRPADRIEVVEYDLCLAWSWEYDLGFVELLRRACAAACVDLLEVTPQTLQSVIAGLDTHSCAFRALFDRASDCDETFLGLNSWALTRDVKRLNRRELAVTAWNKAVLHSLFEALGIPVPRTIMLRPFCEQPDHPAVDLSSVGPAFTVKPACQGGGDGVRLQATSWDQVIAARAEFPHDEYLIQQSIVPLQLDSRPAWFRVLSCFDRAYPCWWNQRTHVYIPVTEEEERALSLEPLRDLTERIAQTCGLELFSSEVALSVDGQFYVIDYVNDPVDLRLQSQAVDGVPDCIVQAIATRIVDWVKSSDSGLTAPEDPA